MSYFRTEKMNNFEQEKFAKKIIQILDEKSISPSIEERLKLARQYAILNMKKESISIKKELDKENDFASINHNNGVRSIIKPFIAVAIIASIATISTLSIIYVDTTNNILGKNEEFIQKDIKEVQSYQDEIDNDYNEMIQSNNSNN